MPRLWLELRGQAAAVPGPATVVAGIPLVIRVLRMAARAGFDHATLVVDDGERAVFERCLARAPVPEALAIAFAAAPPADGVALEACGIYDRDGLAAAAAGGAAPTPKVVVRTAADRKAARGALEAMVRKSMQADGVLSYLIYRPLIVPFTRLLLRTPVTANQATLAAMVMGVVTAIACALATPLWLNVACALTVGALVLDHVDGDLARLRVRGSRLGEWLDTIADDVTTFAPMAGVGIGMARVGYHPAWMYVLCGSAVVATAVHSKMYVDLARAGLPIDTAYYPWAFGSGMEMPSKPSGLLGYLGLAINYLARRDVFMTAVALTMGLHLWVPLALVLAVRGLAMVPLMGVHQVLRRLRP